MIRVGQLRAVQRAAYFKPQGRRRVFILDGADTMRWTDADLFLKILEEPPESATLILLAQYAGSHAADDSLALPAIPFRASSGRTDRGVPERARPRKARGTKAGGAAGGREPGSCAFDRSEESARLRRSVLDLLHRAVTGEKYGGRIRGDRSACQAGKRIL